MTGEHRHASRFNMNYSLLREEVEGMFREMKFLRGLDFLIFFSPPLVEMLKPLLRDLA